MTKTSTKKISEDTLVDAVLSALNWGSLARLGRLMTRRGC